MNQALKICWNIIGISSTIFMWTCILMSFCNMSNGVMKLATMICGFGLVFSVVLSVVALVILIIRGIDKLLDIDIT